jgi:DNA ligase-1
MFLPPTLLERTELPFDDDSYIFEPKIDGHRLLLSMENGVPRLYTRHGFDVTGQYPELHRVPVSDGTDVVLDGEVAAVDPASGEIRFDTLMERYRLKKGIDIREASVTRPVVYFVFDLLRYGGEDWRGKPLMERRKCLERILEPNGRFLLVPAVEGEGKRLYEAIRDGMAEGIVAKRKDSVYAGRRDPNWLKIDRYRFKTVPIIGYRKNGFGWLIRYEEGGTDVLQESVPLPYRQALLGVAGAIAAGEDRNFVYVEPVLKARIRYRRRAADGTPRSPEFVGFANG